MKKNIMVALLVITGFFAVSTVRAADSWQATLSTTNQVVAPSLSYTPTNTWQNATVYDAGIYVVASNGRKYWTPNGGGSGAALSEPTHKSGIVEVGSGLKWLAIANSRRSLTIQLTESGDVWFIEDTAAAVNGESRLLTGKGMAWVFDDYRGEMNALAGSGTKTITVTER